MTNLALISLNLINEDKTFRYKLIEVVKIE